MKVALLSGHLNGAIDQVMQALQRGLTKAGVDALIAPVYDGPLNLRDFDLVHAGYFAYTSKIPQDYDGPVTANVWHISVGREGVSADHLRSTNVRHIMVDDVMTLQQLGQLGFTNVTYVPLPIEPGKWRHLPYPDEFTVGVFCNDYAYKRFDVVIEACKRAGVKCHPVVLKENRSTYDLDPLNDVYAKCSVLASATFVDTNSMPLREALLCGRPVISTRNDGMARVLRDGRNGLWFDGSVSDLVHKIQQAQAFFESLSSGAKATTMEPIDDIVDTYVAKWRGLLDE